MDEEKEIGIGYMKYSIGDIRYETAFKKIKIYFDAIKNIKNTRTVVKEVIYTLFISNSI